MTIGLLLKNAENSLKLCLCGVCLRRGNLGDGGKISSESPKHYKTDARSTQILGQFIYPLHLRITLVKFQTSMKAENSLSPLLPL